MCDERKILAIIPARSGSKGLPHKNILNCAGKPLIAWTIEAAIRSEHVDKVLVTTDSEDIAIVARKYGAWVPFLRSSDLAQDNSNIIDVVKDVLEKMQLHSYVPEYVTLLQPTSPLRTFRHINEAINEYFQNRKDDLDTLISVYEVDNKILWSMDKDPESGFMISHFGMDFTNPRRQNLPKCYLPNGAIYIAKTKRFNGFYSGNILSYIMNKATSIDVDYKMEFDLAAGYLESNYDK